jgi:hypothetical protein
MARKLRAEYSDALVLPEEIKRKVAVIKNRPLFLFFMHPKPMAETSRLGPSLRFRMPKNRR